MESDIMQISLKLILLFFFFQCLDWEVEMVIVIGKEAKDVQVDFCI